MTISVRVKRPERLVVFSLVAASLFVTVQACAATDASAGASSQAVATGGYPGADTAADPAASDATKQQLIHQLVNLTDVTQLQNVFTQQFIGRVESAMSMFGGTLDPRTIDAIQQQTQAVVQEHIDNGDALYSVLAPVYEKHFNIVELSQLVNFYQSPLGQKLVRVSPQLLTESLGLGQQWGLSLVPEIVSRVRAQLNGQPIPKSDDTDDGGDRSAP